MREPPKPMLGCGSESCPKCETASHCIDHNEVDIGVGVQTFDHEYYCPNHGAFTLVDNDPSDFTAIRKATYIFRDDDG